MEEEWIEEAEERWGEELGGEEGGNCGWDVK